MNRQNLINRLVARKLQTAGNARPICICMANPIARQPGVAAKSAMTPKK